MKVAYRSDVGRVRKNNEDWLHVDMERGIFLLADGMGGHQAGEIASRLAIDTAYAYLKEKVNEANSEKDISKLLVSALFEAHGAVKERSKAEINLMGMGTTLVKVVIKDGKAHICHVGDSRVYLLRDGITQITKDQTVGDYLVDHNIMKREDVPPQKWHTLTQAVGASETLVPELNHVELKEGDLLLLCSDGLTDMLADGEILDIVRKYPEDIEKSVEALIEMANKEGGRDNISVVLIEI